MFDMEGPLIKNLDMWDYQTSTKPEYTVKRLDNGNMVQPVNRPRTTTRILTGREGRPWPGGRWASSLRLVFEVDICIIRLFVS